MSPFLEKFKGMSVHQVTKIVETCEERKDYTYSNLVVNKVHVRAILDTSASGNIVLSRLVRRSSWHLI